MLLLKIFSLLAIAALTVLPHQIAAAPLYDIVYLLDQSGSISASEFNSEKNFASQSANSLVFGPNDTAASLLLYGTTAVVRINLTTNKATFVNTVNSTTSAFSSSSNLTAGLTAAQIQFNTFGRAGAYQILAVLGDGYPNVDVAGITPKLDELAAAGVHVYSIAVGDANFGFMQSITRNQGQTYAVNALTAFIGNIAALPTRLGDYNRDNTISSADYDTWRTAFGSASFVADGNQNDIIEAADYVLWRKMASVSDAGGGLMSLSSENGAIPEPGTMLLVAVGLVEILVLRLRRSKVHP